MIEFKTFELDNGLKVIVHEDPTVQIAVINVLYNVGSKDEDPSKTGFAHLFEHLMFGGSKHIENYDTELQKVGGENNAFTNPDITNYYMTLPIQSIETGFWLESDRMLGLSFDPKVLEVQRKVVIEEFKQRYLNQPYGDVWLKLRPLAYQEHSYQWPTIGKDISHIEEATMEDVKSFFHKYYTPNNAVLVVAGNVKLDEVKRLSEKWFGPIPRGYNYQRNIPAEPQQQGKRVLDISADVPSDLLYMTFHMPGKFDNNYHASDLLSDVLGRGKSSRLYRRLVGEEKLFNTIGAYVTGSIDPGLLVIQGKPKENVDILLAEEKIREVMDDLISSGIEERELQKVKNQAESTLVFSEVEVLTRAMNLAVSTISGNTGLVNEEVDRIQAVQKRDVELMAEHILQEENSSVLYYKSKAS